MRGIPFPSSTDSVPSRARRDVAVISGGAVVLFALEARFAWADTIANAAYRRSAAWTDSFFTFALLFLFAFAALALRRWRELRQEVGRRVQSEERLRESEERYRILIESSPDGILVHRDEKVLYANAAHAETLGVESAASLIGRSVYDMVHPDDLHAARGRVRRAYAARGRGEMIALRLVRRDGTPREVEIISAPVFYDGLPAIQAVVRDVTDRRAAERTLAESEARYRALVEHSPHGVAVHIAGRYVYINPAGAQIFGAPSPATIVGRGVLDFTTPERSAQIRTRMETLYDDPAPSPMIETEIIGLDGQHRTIETQGIPTMHEGKPARQIVFRDITARKAAAEQLRASEQRYRQMFENHPAMQWILDPATGNIIDANPAACAFYGYSWETLTRMNIAGIVVLSPAELRADLQRWAREPRPRSFYQNRLASGEIRDVEVRCATVEIAGRTLLYAIIHDITDRRLMEEQLIENALHDGLTGLPNRALFMDRLRHALDRHKSREGRYCAALYLDFDRFKTVNDSLGHLYGDELLIKLARRLVTCVRPADTVARLGGDEFVILMDDIADVSEAVKMAERIHQALLMPIIVRGHEIFITTSIGVAYGTRAYHHPEEVLRDADTAMYRAKALGKARHVVFDAAMHARAVALLQLESDLRRAVERKEFVVMYQPIVSLDTRRIAGFEALVRWRHPRLGMVSPAEFVPLAEETGMIVPLDRWMLAAACTQLREWQENYPTLADLSVSVNLSGRHFAEADFLPHILATLDATGVESHRLKLEITESALIEHADAATDALWQLRQRGVQTRLDDFGVGYSSLNYLRRFPIDAVKIDRSFVSGVAMTSEHTAVIRAITMLARELDIAVIAEGIETEHQAAHLRDLNCEYGQGYLFSVPINGEMATELLATQAERATFVH